MAARYNHLKFVPLWTATCLFILLFLISCNQNNIDFERTTLTINNQEFEVLTANAILEYYISTNSDYTKTIYSKIRNEFGKDTEFPFLFDALQPEMKPKYELAGELEIFKQIDFVQLADSVYSGVTKKLAGPDTKILFLPANPAFGETFKKMGTGFHAFTPGAGKIIVTFDTSIDDWEEFLPYALSHEYHHCVWTFRNFETPNFTPLEYLIFEGRADSFASELYPGTNHPFLSHIDKESMKKTWSLIQPALNSRETELTDLLYYGSEDISFGSVYSIGFQIVESFKKFNPEINDNELIDLSPAEILARSNFEEEMKKN